jgi:hypothetical protein
MIRDVETGLCKAHDTPIILGKRSVGLPLFVAVMGCFCLYCFGNLFPLSFF